ncbi:hypothetical protein TNCV_3168841 [Trichonephila clavipes]|nr:hypothetical protein TNCV_3168841 [Trichonephila clavipes]
MEVTRVEQCAYIKITVLRGRNAMECHSELEEALGNNVLPYRIVARWAGNVSTTDDQRGVMNALMVFSASHNVVVTVAGNYIEGLKAQACHVNFMCTVLSFFCTMKAVLPCILP